MSEKYLIINADDFGSSYGANEATEILFNKDCITSTTIMTPCNWAEDAITRAKSNPKIKVGLHTTLTAEWKNVKWGALSRGDVRSLLDKFGNFYATCDDMQANASNEAVVLELEAQIEWMKNHDYMPTHADNHMGSLYGLNGKVFLREAIDFCAKYNLPFRMPKNFENLGKIPDELKLMVNQVFAYAEAVGVPVIDYLYSFGRPLTNDDNFETIRDGYINVIEKLKAGISEIYMHPMVDTPDGRASVASWQMRKWEFETLQDEQFRNSIESNNIKLVGWDFLKR